MRIILGVFLVFSLIILMISPVYANVTSVTLEKSFYTNEEKMTFIGKEQDGQKSVFIVIRDQTGGYVGMVSDPSSDSDGTFKTIERGVTQFFHSKGAYNATAFTDEQGEKKGITITLQYDGKQVSTTPDFVLKLNSIPDKTIEEKKTLVFTPTLTESLSGVVFSLEKNPPVGASIDNETGKFVWTPTDAQGPASYVFDIVVKKGPLADRESIKITVTEPAPITQPEPTPKPAPEPEPIQKPVDKVLGIAPFVDPTKDPQSYVDRYNNEPKYKEWFDKTYPEYSSIYQAVGLEKPKEIAPFVDPTLDPHFYIDRYNNEPKFKDWFDKNYPNMTIYDAIGLDKPEIKEQESGECGSGTILINGVCTVDDSQKQGGGCLIATAIYGSEMAPQVQFLREIRDNKVMSTASGISFMTGFNQLYYSFSPTIADLERENPAFKEMVKIGITPMLSSLSIMSAADSEQEIVGYGIGVILMNVGMYFVAPAMLFYSIKKVKTRLSF